ncbi:MAG: SDR family oxidoreductase [Clostridiales bacterium]|nr:SDR family oxidoreductase [Clostridiales bacterium]
MKTAIVFGGSKGIGAQIAREFANCGYFVVINYNSSKLAAEKLAAELKNSIAIKADVKNYKEVKALADEVIKLKGQIDVAVVSSGISRKNLIIDTTEDEIKDVIDTNLIGTINAIKAVSENMLSNHKGKIITIASMWGEVGASMESIYSASKGGVIAFTKAMAKELGYNGINVNCISPGLIDTDMNKDLSKEDIDSLIENTPSSRIGVPQDIAKAAIFLASDDASFINGQVISINGGFII